jgi:hypothetical protein
MLELANMTTEGPPPSFQTSWSASDSDSAALTAMDMTDQPLNGSATDSAAAGQNANGANNNNRVAVAVACVQCRSRHLKCDGATRCARCVAEGIACSYVKSRRGWKGPRKSSQRLVTVHPPGSSIGTILFSSISEPSSSQFCSVRTASTYTDSFASQPLPTNKTRQSTLLLRLSHSKMLLLSQSYPFRAQMGLATLWSCLELRNPYPVR